jgi:hypothetical protein
MTLSTEFAHRTFTDVQIKDAFVAGYMHAACGHANDEFRETYRNASVHSAWRIGYAHGLRYNGKRGWTMDAVAHATGDYGHWRAALAVRESVLRDRNGAHR